MDGKLAIGNSVGGLQGREEPDEHLLTLLMSFTVHVLSIQVPGRG
jgi:hypothetical protein